MQLIDGKIGALSERWRLPATLVIETTKVDGSYKKGVFCEGHFRVDNE